MTVLEIVGCTIFWVIFIAFGYKIVQSASSLYIFREFGNLCRPLTNWMAAKTGREGIIWGLVFVVCLSVFGYRLSKWEHLASSSTVKASLTVFILSWSGFWIFCFHKAAKLKGRSGWWALAPITKFFMLILVPVFFYLPSINKDPEVK